MAKRKAVSASYTQPDTEFTKYKYTVSNADLEV